MTQLRTPWAVRATTGSGNNTYLVLRLFEFFCFGICFGLELVGGGRLYRLALRVDFALETWPLLMRSNLTCVASMAWG